ncbi:MAG: formyl transferase [Hydrogenophilales bacterium 28-61-23]|nr:MAG: formyl transferase [Hydrogenophilales bacterium 28-61-23]
MNMKIGYFADGPWSHRALYKLLEDATLSVSFICARSDRPDQDLARIAAENGIPFLTHPRVNSDEFVGQIERYGCDIFVSMSFNQIFRQRLIDATKYKIINCHAGKLPFYRGRNIINWALINDEAEFGITVHYVDDGIDTGDIILQKTYPITDADDYATLLERAYSGCGQVLYDAIKKIQAGNVVRIKQSEIHPTGFYCSARKEGDENLDWSMTSREVFNFVRAICRPGPEARGVVATKEVRINRVCLVDSAPSYKGIAGAIIKVDSDSFVVKTADSFVRVTDWTTELKLKVGDRFE